MKAICRFLKWIDRVTDEYSDTMAFVMITVGGLLAAVGFGVLHQEGFAHDLVYVKYPISIKIGLMAVVFGFTSQLHDNLVGTHKMNEKVVLWIGGFVFTSLMLLVLLN